MDEIKCGEYSLKYGVRLLQTLASVEKPHKRAQLRDGTLTELVHPIPNIDVIIGLDVLESCTLLKDGPRRQFSIFF